MSKRTCVTCLHTYHWSYFGARVKYDDGRYCSEDCDPAINIQPKLTTVTFTEDELNMLRRLVKADDDNPYNKLQEKLNA